MERVGGEIFELVGVLLEVVEFLEAVGVADVAVAGVAEAVGGGLVAVELEGGEGEAAVGGGGFRERDDKGVAIALVGDGEAGEVAEGGIDVC